jgi:hypothetical protein
LKDTSLEACSEQRDSSLRFSDSGGLFLTYQQFVALSLLGVPTNTATGLPELKAASQAAPRAVENLLIRGLGMCVLLDIVLLSIARIASIRLTPVPPLISTAFFGAT